MKIWLINPYGPIEGENWRDYSFNQFGKYLAEKGHSIIWWTSNFAHHFKKYRSVGWKDIAVNNRFIIRLVPSTSYKKNFGIGRLIKDISFAKELKKRIQQEEQPDVIISAENPLMFGIPTFPFAKRNNIPVIIDQMDIWPEFLENGFGKLKNVVHLLFKPVYINRYKNYCQAAGYMALGSNYLLFARKLTLDGEKKPYALVYNGVDTISFRKQMLSPMPKRLLDITNSSIHSYHCIFAGTFGPSYDIDTILNCAKKCSENKLDVDFWFAGSGSEIEKVLNVARKEGNVIYLGSLLPNELAPVYAKCDIGLCAYSAKSNVDMPDKFYDYCAAGLAVVNSLTEEVSNYINDNEVGFNYFAGDVQSMYNAIQKLTMDNVLLKRMKENAFSLGNNFDCNIQNEKMERLLYQVFKNKSRR